MSKKPKQHLDWSNITDEVTLKLRSDIHQMVLDSVGVDCDGDCGIQTIIIDRNKYEPNHYLPISYSHKIKNRSAADKRLQDLVANVKMACDALDKHISIMSRGTFDK